HEPPYDRTGRHIKLHSGDATTTAAMAASASRVHGPLTRGQPSDGIPSAMRENVLRWVGGLAAVSVTVGFVPLGAVLVTFRAIREVAGSLTLLGAAPRGMP